MQRRRRRALLAACAAAVAALAPAEALASSFDVEGHRGTRGLRPENTLAAFGKALQVGVTTLELDTGVTEDGVDGLISNDVDLLQLVARRNGLE